MATTTHDDGFHEIQLNGKQLVFLFMAVTVVSVVIFLCGVLVGRGLRPTTALDDPLASTAPAAVLPDAPPATPAATGSGAPATANENLSYPNRLAANQPTAERLRESDATAAKPTAKPAAPAAPPAAAPAEKPAPAPVQAATTGASEAPSGEPAGSGFAIQVTALGQRAEADTIVKRLTSKGYPAYVVNPAAGTPAVYRVRIGKFKDRREAESVAARLQKEEQFNPWIIR